MNFVLLCVSNSRTVPAVAGAVSTGPRLRFSQQASCYIVVLELCIFDHVLSCMPFKRLVVTFWPVRLATSAAQLQCSAYQCHMCNFGMHPLYDVCMNLVNSGVDKGQLKVALIWLALIEGQPEGRPC